MYYVCVCSNYPSNRVKKEEDGDEVGVMGNVQLVQNVVLSSQPISSIDWSPDKVNHTHSLCATPIVSLYCRRDCLYHHHLTRQFECAL